MVELKIVNSLPGLLELRSDWASLVRSCEYATPFHGPDWLLTWWKHFGSGELHVFVFRSGGRLVGIVPCFLHEWQGLRQFTLIGSGISDYLEPLFVGDEHRAVLEVLAESLRADLNWDICCWQDLSADSILGELWLGNGFEVCWTEDMACSRFKLEGAFDDYWRERPAGLRRNARRYLDKARSIDTPKFDVCCYADSELTDALIRLHTARWQKQGESGMVVANKSARFLRDVVKELEREKMIRFFSLRFQRRIAATILSFPCRNILFSYLSGFDPEYEEFGFGRTLLHDSIRWAFEHGYEAWDFLRGDETYKSWWGAEPIRKSRLTIRRRSAAGGKD